MRLVLEGGCHATFAVEGGGGPLEKERRVYERSDDTVWHGQPVGHLSERTKQQEEREEVEWKAGMTCSARSVHAELGCLKG